MKHQTLTTEYYPFDSDTIAGNNAGKPIIELADPHAGAGKSRSIFNYAIETDEQVIIATPTDPLSFQYNDYFVAKGVFPTVISRETNPDSPSYRDFRDAVKSGKSPILVHNRILHETTANLSSYKIIEDEIRDPLEIIKFQKAQYIRPLITSLISVEITVAAKYYRLELTPAALDIALHGWDYAGVKENEDLLKLCKHIHSPHYIVYVLADSYSRFHEGNLHNIQFWSIRLPSIYKGCIPTLVGANAYELLLPKLWKDAVEFRYPAFIQADYQDLKHKSEFARIKYISKRALTGKFFDDIGRQKIADKTADWIYRKYPTTPHIVGINKLKSGAQVKWKLKGLTGEPVKLVSHGLNGFKTINMAVYLAAQYYDKATYNFLKEVYHISPDEVTRAFTYDRLYQFVMRISARVMDAEEEFVMVVPDKGCADFLQEIFGSDSIEFIDIGIPELHQEDEFAQTPAERRASDTRDKAQRRDRNKAMENQHANTQQYDGFKFIAWVNKYAQQLVTADFSWFDLGAYLENEHKTYEPRNKSQAKCFREGDLADAANHKLVNNIKSTKLVILDMDVVKRDPKDLSDFLYDRGWSHYVFNSHGSTALEPRIRVIIGLDQAVNAANYSHILNLIRADIDARFTAGTYEIDESKKSINNKFHDPSVSVYKSPIFFARHVMKSGSKFEPKFVDVQWFLSRDSVETKVGKPAPADRSSGSGRANKKQAIEDIIDRWSVAPGQSLGSKHFHQAAVDLKKLGLCREDCIQILTENRHRFGHGQDRDAVYTVGRVFGARK